jgi:hypothetical protein
MSPSIDRARILSMSRRELRALLRAGHAIDPRALDDQEYRGIALGLPDWMVRLSWKTFQKTFHRDPSTGALRGWNVRIEQRGLDAASVPLVRRGAPFTFGHYRVVDLPPRPVPRGLAAGLLIDYTPAGGLGGACVRDPLVAVNAGSVELLLGWTYFDLRIVRIGTPSYFILERERPLGHVPTTEPRERSER